MVRFWNIITCELAALFQQASMVQSTTPEAFVKVLLTPSAKKPHIIKELESSQHPEDLGNSQGRIPTLSQHLRQDADF